MVQKGLRLLVFFSELGVPPLNWKNLLSSIFSASLNVAAEKYMTFWTLRDQETLPKDYFSMTQWKKKAALNWDEAAGGNWAGKGLHGWRPPPPPTTSSHLSQIQFRTIPSSCVHKRPAECTRLFNQLLPVWNVDCLCDAQQCKGCWLSDVSE